MLKRFMGALLTLVMVFNMVCLFAAETKAQAFDNYQVRTIVDTTIRKTYSQDSAIVRKVAKGTVLTIVGEHKNDYGNLWYKVKDEGYIYSGKVEKINSTKPTLTPTVVPVNYQVKAKKDTTVRSEYYDKTTVLRNVSKGTVLTVVGEVINKYDNLWYKVQGGGYIYSGNFDKVTISGKPTLTPSYTPSTSKEPVHQHSHKLVRYGTAHPHYAEYECSCGNGYCGTETKKVEGCKECYPHVHSHKLVRYGAAHPHYAEYECSCGNGYCSNETKKVEGCKECYPHIHSHKFVRYGKAHPHYAEYECICGNGYCSNETKKVEGCKECYPHEHEYELIEYEKEHPHFAIYECTCGNGYSGTKSQKQTDCSICYPYLFDENEKVEEHNCKYKETGIYSRFHPHYSIQQCNTCGKKKFNMNRKIWDELCGNCNNPFMVAYGGYADLDGMIYTVAFNEITVMSAAERRKISQTLHTSLDVCGLVAPEPLAMVCDGVNVAYYLVEGDKVNAGFSGMSFIPVLGYVSGTGKVVGKTGTIAIDATAGSLDDIFKVTTKIVIKNPENISDVAEIIVKNADNYNDDVLKGIEKISDSKTVSLSEAFYKNDVLLDKKSAAKVTTDAGLSYGPYSKTKDNTLVHIIDRHNLVNKGTSKADNFFKSTDNQTIFKTIDDVYDNGELLASGERAGRTSYYIKSSYEIGSDREDILCLVLDGNTHNVITAYPVYEVPKNVKYE